MTAIRIRMFVHGNAVVPQLVGGGAVAAPGPLMYVDGIPWTDVHGLRNGPGVVFRGKAGNPNRNYFHVSIPSPNPYPVRFTTNQDRSDPPDAHFYGPLLARVINVFFGHVADPGVILERVFAFDGGNLISLQDSPRYPVVTVTPHIITAGLGVSFQVNFTREGNITFNSVGAEFQLDGLP